MTLVLMPLWIAWPSHSSFVRVYLLVQDSTLRAVENFVWLDQCLVTGNRLPGNYLSRPRVTGKPFIVVYAFLFFSLFVLLCFSWLICHVLVPGNIRYLLKGFEEYSGRRRHGFLSGLCALIIKLFTIYLSSFSYSLVSPLSRAPQGLVREPLQ